MATPTPAEARFQMTLVSTYAGQRYMNVQHYRGIGLAGEDVFEACLGLIDGAKVAGGLVEKLLACWSPDIVLDRIWVQCISPTRFTKVEDLVTGGAGTWAGIGSTTGNTSAALTKRTAYAGRRFRGRMQVLSPAHPDAQEDGELTLASKGRLEPFATALNAVILWPFVPTVAFQPILYHPVGVTPNYSDLDQVIVQTEVRTQRTRTVRQGI